MTFRENAARLTTDRKLFVFIGLVAGFSILGPFGTYEVLSFWPRLVFWSLLIASIGAVMHLAISVALTGETLTALPWWLRIGIGSMVAAVPAVGLIIFMTGYFFPAPVSADSFPLLWGQVAFIGAVAGVVEYKKPGEPAQGENEGEAAPKVPRTRLHDRLKGEEETAEIVSLSMHDHYVEITTKTGKQMVLMRLGDAIAELDGLPGLQVHRSHWVALSHISTLTKQGRKHVISLSDGRELPVSGGNLEAVRAALAPAA